MAVWRIQHANLCDYTFHSSVHRTYSRIVFFLIEYRLLELVPNMNIKIMTFSDHAPVTMKMKIEGAQNRINIWGLNKELLQDKEAEDRIKKELE